MYYLIVKNGCREPKCEKRDIKQDKCIFFNVLVTSQNMYQYFIMNHALLTNALGYDCYQALREHLLMYEHLTSA